MPNSFSRFLTPDELKEVRAVYLKSLEAEGVLDAATPEAPADDNADEVAVDG